MERGAQWRFVGCLAALALAGCGGTSSDTDAGATHPAADVPAADVPVADGGAATGDAATADAGTPTGSTTYPAFRPDIPQVADFGGDVLHTARIVPVFVSGGDAGTYPFESQITDFLTRYMASGTWLAQVGEYGPGAGTVSAPVHIDGATLPPNPTDAAHLRTWAAAQVQSGAWGAPTGDDVYVLLLDPGRQVSLGSGGALCVGTGGYHTDVQDMAGRRVSVAVIPNCRNDLDTLTQVISHELVEAATDPYPDSVPAFLQPAIDTPPDGAWAIAYAGGEVGDMCEHRTDSATRPADVGYSIQRTWSNMAALAYTDPCVPVPGGSVYFNSAPALLDMVQVQVSSRAGAHPVEARGVVIPAGGTAMVSVRLFSTAPTTGPWRLTTQEVVTGTAQPVLRFTWDRTSGRNGDVLHLTITPRVAIPNGRTFLIRSTLDTVTTTWVGAAMTL